MRTILKLTVVAVPLLVAGAALAAPQPPGIPAVPRLTNVAPKLPGPAGACPPGYAQDQQAVHEALQAHAGDPAAQEQAIAAIPCLKVAAHSAAPDDPASARTDKPH